MILLQMYLLMIERINQILKVRSLTSRQFAEEIGIQPSGMSHILSGRNRPSLDFIIKVINRYPDINISWLVFGTGDMFTNVNLPKNQTSSDNNPTLFPALSQPMVEDVNNLPQQQSDVENNGEKQVINAEKTMSDTNLNAIDGFNGDNLSEERLATTDESGLSAQSNDKTVASNNVDLASNNKYLASNSKTIDRIVVFYSDRTFVEYIPEEKRD